MNHCYDLFFYMNQWQFELYINFICCSVLTAVWKMKCFCLCETTVWWSEVTDRNSWWFVFCEDLSNSVFTEKLWKQQESSVRPSVTPTSHPLCLLFNLSWERSEVISLLSIIPQPTPSVRQPERRWKKRRRRRKSRRKECSQTEINTVAAGFNSFQNNTHEFFHFQLRLAPRSWNPPREDEEGGRRLRQHRDRRRWSFYSDTLPLRSWIEEVQRGQAVTQQAHVDTLFNISSSEGRQPKRGVHSLSVCLQATDTRLPTKVRK